MELNIEVARPSGERLDLLLEEEDGRLFVEVRDWDSGEPEFVFEFEGTLNDFRAKIGAS